MLVYMCYNVHCFFFFQAEDGIRDTSVTGVQTCALPISDKASPAAARKPRKQADPRRPRRGPGDSTESPGGANECEKCGDRSEERRVGKECRSGGWPYH